MKHYWWILTDDNDFDDKILMVMIMMIMIMINLTKNK